MKKLSVLFLLIFNECLFDQIVTTEFVNYKWLGRHAAAHISTYEIELRILKNYNQNHWYYGEGVITTITYPDSSLITLHCGFNTKIPFFDGPDYFVEEIIVLDNYIIRKGTNMKSKLYWEERNFKQEPINIAFDYVPKEKINVYQKVLDSIQIKK
jgi:hypothetical protein